MMPTYKFTYFGIKAKGETARMLFAMKGQKYEDIRVPSDKWEAMKEKTPFKQLPMLEVDGIVYCQSRAIERYLATEFDLYGKTSAEKMKADMVRDCLSDIRSPLEAILFAEKEENKAKLKKEFLDTTAPDFFKRLEKFVLPNGFINGSKVSWPDLEMYNVLAFAKEGAGLDISPILAEAPNIKKLRSNVESQKEIKAWIQKRPKNDF